MILHLRFFTKTSQLVFDSLGDSNCNLCNPTSWNLLFSVSSSKLLSKPKLSYTATLWFLHTGKPKTARIQWHFPVWIICIQSFSFGTGYVPVDVARWTLNIPPISGKFLCTSARSAELVWRVVSFVERFHWFLPPTCPIDFWINMIHEFFFKP